MELVTLHLITLSVTALGILIADHDGLQYVRGKKQTLNLSRVKRLHYTVLTGLGLMILTGAFLFADAWGELVDEPAFYIKMLMVLALVTNSFVIGNLMHIATHKPFSDLSYGEKTKLFMSGLVSGVCWVGSATIGMFFL